MLDTKDRELTVQIAGYMATELLRKDFVQAVQLADVPHHTDGPPFYVGPEYRLIVVVDEELAMQYLLRRIEPDIIFEQDGAGATITSSGDVADAMTFMAERPETARETAWSLLEENEEFFFDRLRDQYRALAPEIGEVSVGDDLGVVVLHADWVKTVEYLFSLKKVFGDGTEITYFDPKEWQHAAEHFLTFDSNTGQFVKA
jgi:hypothetical protein